MKRLESNNLKVFERKKIKCPKQDSQYQLRGRMHERDEPLLVIVITLNFIKLVSFWVFSIEPWGTCSYLVM